MRNLKLRNLLVCPENCSILNPNNLTESITCFKSSKLFRRDFDNFRRIRRRRHRLTGRRQSKRLRLDGLSDVRDAAGRV